jgi:hypothetical protein
MEIKNIQKGEIIMGVRRSDYIVIGLNVGYEKYGDDKFEEYEELMEVIEPGKMTYLIDSMGGEYFVVGEVVKCDKHGEDGMGFNQFSTTADTPFIQSKERVRKHIRDNFGIDDEPQLIVLTHWT